MGSLLDKIINDTILTDEDIEEALYMICDSVHASCNAECPAFNENGGSIPFNDDKSNCVCFKDGMKMLQFIRTKKQEKKKDKLYFAIGPFCWGRGKSVEEAVKNVKVNWPRRDCGRFNSKNLAIFETEDAEAYVDDFDGTLWADKKVTRQIQKAGKGK